MVYPIRKSKGGVLTAPKLPRKPAQVQHLKPPQNREAPADDPAISDTLSTVLESSLTIPIVTRRLVKSPKIQQNERPTTPGNTPQARAPSRRARSRGYPQARRRSEHAYPLPIRSATGHPQGAGEQAPRRKQVRGAGVRYRRRPTSLPTRLPMRSKWSRFTNWGILRQLYRNLTKTLDYLDIFARFKDEENIKAVERLLNSHTELEMFERSQLGK